MLKTQRKDTYQSRWRSLQLPPSVRFPTRVWFPPAQGNPDVCHFEQA
jgi:hypothetical protein